MEELPLQNTSKQQNPLLTVEDTDIKSQSMRQIAFQINSGSPASNKQESFQKEKNGAQPTINQNFEHINILRQQKSQLSTYISHLKITSSKKKSHVSAIFEKFQAVFKQSVNKARDISQNDLDRLRFQPRPSPLLLFVLKPIYLLLQGDPRNLPRGGPDKVKWLSVTKMLSQYFSKRIAKFHIEDISKAIVDYVQREYLEENYWNLENIRKVSAIAFILAIWAEYQILYFELLAHVQPLKQEIAMIYIVETKLLEQQRVIVEKIFQAEHILTPEPKSQYNKEILLEKNMRQRDQKEI